MRVFDHDPSYSFGEKLSTLPLIDNWLSYLSSSFKVKLYADKLLHFGLSERMNS